jgi:acetyl-CoA C-acetyltransferase
VPAVTVDRQCGSGQQAVSFAAQAIVADCADLVIACGVESMSRVPMPPAMRPGAPLGPQYSPRELVRYNVDSERGELMAQGASSELMNARFGLTRAELDDFSARSHERAWAATQAGRFAAQLVPLTIDPADPASDPITADEGIRPSIDRDKISTLRTVFADDGQTTAANSSQISDGAAALLIADRDFAGRHGLTPRARFRALSVAAADPVIQFTAILDSTAKALKRSGLAVDDIDLFEVNEAFAGVPLMLQKHFGVPDDRLNVNGGSVAIGHPLGSTGARMLTDPPNGQQVEHTDGYTVTLPIGPKGSGSSYRLNDNATQQAFPLNYRGAAKVHGRNVYEYNSTGTGAVKSPSLLKTLPPALPGTIAAQLMPKLPPASQEAIKQAGPIPSAIPLSYVATTNYDLQVDKQLGSPLAVAIDRTVTAYADLGGKQIELLPVLQLNVKTTDKSVASAAKTAKKSGLMLTAMSTWLPTILTILGVLLLLWTVWREVRRRRSSVDGVSRRQQPVKS